MLFKFGSKINNKIYHLFSHLDRFSENFGKLSKEQGERFHHGTKVMEERYQQR